MAKKISINGHPVSTGRNFLKADFQAKQTGFVMQHQAFEGNLLINI